MKPTTKSELFKKMLSEISNQMSNSGCNDFEVANTPELYNLIEASAARNLNCKSIAEFKSHPDYRDYKVQVSTDGKTIYTQDFVILEILKHELGL